MNAYFVSATGTEIGKTYVSASLLKAWRAGGKDTFAVKPVMSGFGENALEESDAGELLAAMDQTVTPEAVSDICLHRFEPPLAPNHAMRLAGMDQDYQAILNFTHRRMDAAQDNAIGLVEGAGGLMSPITDHKLNLDLIIDLGLPVILVTTGYLGAVSHTLSALNVLHAKGIEIAAMVVNQPTTNAQSPSHLMNEVALFDTVRSFALHYGEAGSDLATLLG